MHSKLEHDFSSVRFNGPDRDSQPRRNLLVRLPPSQETDDFEFAWSWSGPCPFFMLACCFEKSFQHDFRHLWGEETLALRNCFHGFRETVREIGFQNVPVSPGFQ